MPVFNDIHSHLLPGIDDGSRNIEQSLEYFTQGVKEGLSNIILTPHVRLSDALLDRELEQYQEIFANFKPEIGKKFPELILHLGAELYIIEPFQDFSDPRLRLNGSRYVLIEFSMLNYPLFLSEEIFRIKTEGYLPILAHPERYRVFMQKPDLLEELIQVGARIQLDTGNFIGRFGSKIKKMAEKLLREGKVDIISSDTHASERRPFDLASAYWKAVGMVGVDGANRIFQHNPARVIHDQELLEVNRESTGPRKGLFRKFISKVSRNA